MIEEMDRPWGHWVTHLDFPGRAKVKTLVVHPNEQLSIQRHFHRNETWYLLHGKGTVYMEGIWHQLYAITHINQGVWHSLMNTGTEDLVVLEVQWGVRCEESDIERK